MAYVLTNELMFDFHECLVHCLGRKLNETGRGIIQLLDQYDSAGNRQGTEHKGDHGGGIGWRKQSKTGEDDREPEDQHNQEREGNAMPCPDFQRPSRLNELARLSEAKRVQVF